jgi:hypothetical protein
VELGLGIRIWGFGYIDGEVHKSLDGFFFKANNENSFVFST